MIKPSNPWHDNGTDNKYDNSNAEQCCCENEDVQLSLKTVHIYRLRGLDEGYIFVNGAAGEAEEAVPAWKGGGEEAHDIVYVCVCV